MMGRVNDLVRACRVLGAMCAAFAASQAWAQVHEGDIILDTSTGQIRAGTFVGGGFENRSIFITRLGENAPNVSSDPGFDCLPNSFVVGTRNGLTLIGPLQEWNGSAFVASDTEYLRVEYLTLATDGPAPEAAADQTVNTFTISVQANGQWHRHVRWVLRDGPELGVYAQRMHVRSDATSPTPSEPFYLLINQGNAPHESLDAAAAWLESHTGGGAACAECPADYNQDGGVDGSDLAAFFTHYEAGELECADTNLDGGIDGSNLAAFFVAYESGGC